MAKGLFDGIAAGLPALMRAHKLQAKASTVGFDWNDARLVLAKIKEEIGEIEAELDRQDGGKEAAAGEIGDLLFAVVNLARHLKVDADQALRGASIKFERRFPAIEEALAAEGRAPPDASLDEMEALWQRAQADRNRPPVSGPVLRRHPCRRKGAVEGRLPFRRHSHMGGGRAVRIVGAIEDLADLVEPVKLAERGASRLTS